MAKAKRISGFYWVKDSNGEWAIAKWESKYNFWLPIGGQALSSSVFQEIDENQLIKKED